jgi:hypothetical protein
MTVHWRKSSRSTGVTDEACVEVAQLDTGVGVRDSKNPGDPYLTLTTPRFAALLHRARRGALDRD